ncbi:helix-turn-helix transcriptional regulator [Staphylococcus pasteuri]|uniref:helix-turn-helix transcriptional regulator n=1 Tax=Staphylococcus pasteuri TaxID=45972 RepID=UPI0010BA7599|nr:helix-turn-helix transcriptional regulator [Staphylococcus pasteuri]EAC3257015.1 transcriptional regulator [Listeria monocytogenes]
MKNQIKTLRKERKMSQKELGQRAEVSRQTINAIENDKYDPTLVLAFRLAAILETNVDTLFESDM